MRTKRARIRDIAPDPLYHSKQVAKLINRVMLDGKRSTAQAAVYHAFDIIKEKTKEDPLNLFEKAVENISPRMEVRSRRVGGAAYQVPMPVRGPRGFSLSLRWLVSEANKRPNKEYHTFAEKLAAEILDSINNDGGAIQKKLTSHKMAEANKAFAHFRW
jgi:small subunit ribosomal protein S7